MEKTAKANVTPVRQRTQFSCMSTSMMMCLQANGMETNEDEVNAVMGARPMKGASWEQALACAQHYGMRGILMVPCTVKQLKTWTDQGVPVMIAWNPEGREWSHASVVFDVTESEAGLMVHVADPNIPNPDKTTRVMTEDEFYGKWFEKWPNYLVRRPGLAIMREISPEGRQVMASRTASVSAAARVAGKYYTRERRQEINQGISREENQEGWAQRQRYDRSNQRSVDDAARRMREDREHRFKIYSKIGHWMMLDGNLAQRKLGQWFQDVLMGYGYDFQGKRVEDVVAVAGQFKRPEDVYADREGHKFLLEVQRLLGLSKPTDRPGPFNPDDLENASFQFSTDLQKQWRQVEAFDKKVPKIAQDVEKYLQNQANRLKASLPSDMGDLEVVIEVKRGVFGSRDGIFMPLDEVGGYPSNMKVNTVLVGYPLFCKVRIGGYSHRGGLEIDLVAGVFPHLEKQPKLRVLGISKSFGRQEETVFEVKKPHPGSSHYYWPGLKSAVDVHSGYTLQQSGYQQTKPWASAKSLINKTFAGGLADLQASQEVHQKEQEDIVRRREIRERQDAELKRQREEAARLKQEEKERIKKEKAEKRRQRENKPVEDSGEDQKIQILETLADKVKGWPEGLALVEKVIAEYKGGKKPSPDDLKAIRNYLYKNRMRDEANHFRKAGDKEAIMASFDLMGFGKDIKKALLKQYPVAPVGISVAPFFDEGYIATEWGRDYFRNPDWDNDLLYQIFDTVAKRHKLRGRLGRYKTKDGEAVVVGVAASHSSGGKIRLAAGGQQRQAKVDEKLMLRAALLLIYKGEKEAAKILMDDGISAEDAYLAVKAGAVMNHQPDKLIDKVVQRYAHQVTSRNRR